MTASQTSIEQHSLMEDRGLLDLAVELSLRDITAGSDFTLFVKIKNPFTKPIWIEDVHVSLPSELQLIHDPDSKKRMDEEAQKEAEEQHKREEAVQKDEAKQRELKKDLEELEARLKRLTQELSNNPDSSRDLQQLIQTTALDVQTLVHSLGRSRSETVLHFDSSVNLGNMKIASSPHTKQVISFDSDANVGTIEISDISASSEARDPRGVLLISDRPYGAALQPGNTAIYKVVLTAKNNWFFRPSQYRLQFSVNYTFIPALNNMQSKDTPAQVTPDRPIFTNSISHELAIRSSLHSISLGAAIGGFIGGLVQLLKNAQIPLSMDLLLTSSNVLTSSITLLIAAILSVIAVIFIARKSEIQSFVSVEDFWGGLLIGFWVGYTGTSFFESLTNISELTSNPPATL